MKIAFYGRIQQVFGGPAEAAIPDGGMSVAALRHHLCKHYQTDAILEPAVRAAVNDEIVTDDQTLFPGDRVEFLSPVSGG